ncbi:hypothetical protein Bbelb_218480 [Branchiostoma belcheri]|nr:hypothetical protein Bbelb_218480 [Branchiostoma belcheri]
MRKSKGRITLSDTTLDNDLPQLVESGSFKIDRYIFAYELNEMRSTPAPGLFVTRHYRSADEGRTQQDDNNRCLRHSTPDPHEKVPTEAPRTGLRDYKVTTTKARIDLCPKGKVLGSAAVLDSLSAYPRTLQDIMGKLRHLLIILLIILKDPNTPEADCSCEPSHCDCTNRNLTIIPQGLPTSIRRLDLTVNSKNWPNGTVSYRYHWCFKRNAGSMPMARHAGRANKAGIATPTPFLTITPDKPEISSSNKSSPSPSLPVLITSICVPVVGAVLIVTFILTIWNKRRTRDPLFRLDPNVVVSGHGRRTKRAVCVMASGDDHQYEDIDNPRVKTGQGQSQANTESNTNTTATVLTSDDDNQYEDIDNPRVKTGQGQSQTNTESKTNNTATVMASGNDQTGQGQSQANTESDTNTTSTVMTSGHDQAWQGQSQANTESNTNTTATAMASGDDHQYEDIDNPLRVKTGQGQCQAFTESKTNNTATVMASGHDQAWQGQSQANTESNTNTTATVMASGDVHQYEDIDNPRVKTGQGQSKANTRSPTIAKLSRNKILALMTKDHGQTRQIQPQVISESVLEAGNVSYGAEPTASQPNSLYKVVAPSQAITDNMAAIVATGYDQAEQSQSQTITESNTDTTCTVVTSGNGQTGQGQSQAITESNTNTTPTVMISGHDQTGQDGKTVPKDPANGHDQTGQGQSQTNTESNTNTTPTVVTIVNGETGPVLFDHCRWSWPWS